MYKAQAEQAQGASNPEQPNGQANSSEKDTVEDVDFEEVK